MPTEDYFKLIAVWATLIAFVHPVTKAEIHHHTFFIEQTAITRLCNTVNVTTVNGQLPGPTLYVRNGDTVVVNTYNNAQYNATLHWHGVRQLRTAWADGPAYVAQCPIPPGGNYTYRFTITGQEGTLWWHAHFSWLSATVYGALVIRPMKGSFYPFTAPHGEIPVILGEWWNTDPMDVITQALLTGGAPNISNAFTINGLPGDLYNCSQSETFKVSVQRDKTYLLRMVNAAVNNAFFFKIARHNLTVVAVDACYTKPYTTDVIFITPGQSADVLLTMSQQSGNYYMAARPYTDLGQSNIDNSTTTAILQYESAPLSSSPILPQFPPFNNTATVITFARGLRSLASLEHRADVPQAIDENIISTVGLGLLPCPVGSTCAGPNNTRFTASMNNVSFQAPNIAILQAYYFGIRGIFTTDFPQTPPVVFNYTGDDIPQSLWAPISGTKVKVLKYNATVQLVFQGTNIVSGENHPMHLHGYSFYVVGEGFGSYNPQTDPATFNLVDPPKRNTVSVPVKGWAAIRFRADNPGVWFLHCHLDDHLSWGLNMVFLVKNGGGPLATLEPPPLDLPKC